MFDNAPIVYSHESLAYDPADRSSSFFLPRAGSDMGTNLVGTSPPVAPQSCPSTVRIAGTGDANRFDSKYTHPSLAHHARPPSLDAGSQANSTAHHRNANASASANAKLARGSVAAAAAHFGSSGHAAKSLPASSSGSPKTAPAPKSFAATDQNSVQARMMPHSGLFFAPVASTSEMASTVPAPKNLNHALAFPHKPGAAAARSADKSVLSHLTAALAQHRQLYTRFEERGMVEEHQRQRLAEQAQRHKELHQQVSSVCSFFWRTSWHSLNHRVCVVNIRVPGANAAE